MTLTPATGTPTTGTLDALQATLAAEHAAIYVYGLLGGRTSSSAEPALHAALSQGYDVHRGQRDQLVRTVRDLEAEPVASAVAYDVPDNPFSAFEVQGAALYLEGRCTATYASLIASSVGDLRRWGLTALTGAAVRRLAFGGDAEAFPGIDGSAIR